MDELNGYHSFIKIYEKQSSTAFERSEKDSTDIAYILSYVTYYDWMESNLGVLSKQWPSPKKFDKNFDLA